MSDILNTWAWIHTRQNDHHVLNLYSPVIFCTRLWRVASVSRDACVGMYGLSLTVLNFWKFTSYCSIKPLWSGMGGSSSGSYLADPTSSIPSHCASIVMTSTVRANTLTLSCPLAIYVRGQSQTPWRLHLSCYDTYTRAILLTCSTLSVCLLVEFSSAGFSVSCNRSRNCNDMLSLSITKMGNLTGDCQSASHDNWCTVGGDGRCRVGEVRAGTTSPMPDHKGFELQ